MDIKYYENEKNEKQKKRETVKEGFFPEINAQCRTEKRNGLYLPDDFPNIKRPKARGGNAGSKIVRPEPLSEGDKVALISPSFYTSRKKLEDAVRSVEMLDLEPVVFPSCINKYDYLAGDDSLRAEDLMRAFSDPSIRAVFCLRGGYGAARILDLIDYKIIRKNPKAFIGFSDITALHTAINQRCGLITYHGPMPTAPYHSMDKEISLSSLKKCLFGKESEYEVQLKEMKILNEGNRKRKENIDRTTGQAPIPDAASDRKQKRAGALSEQADTLSEQTGALSARTGTLSEQADALSALAGTLSEQAGSLPARAGALMCGRLCGGNLTVLAAALGTPYEIETAGKILFLEDVGERTYRIDRAVSSLRLAGRLRACSGILLGTFEGCTPAPGGRTCEQIIKEIAEPLGIPVLSGLPCGHSKPNMTLPFGAWCEIWPQYPSEYHPENSDIPVHTSGKADKTEKNVEPETAILRIKFKTE